MFANIDYLVPELLMQQQIVIGKSLLKHHDYPNQFSPLIPSNSYALASTCSV